MSRERSLDGANELGDFRAIEEKARTGLEGGIAVDHGVLQGTRGERHRHASVALCDELSRGGRRAPIDDEREIGGRMQTPNERRVGPLDERERLGALGTRDTKGSDELRIAFAGDHEREILA